MSEAGVFVEVALLFDVVDPLTPSERLLIVGNMADEVKIAHLVLARFAAQLFKENAVLLELVDNRLLLALRVPGD